MNELQTAIDKVLSKNHIVYEAEEIIEIEAAVNEVFSARITALEQIAAKLDHELSEAEVSDQVSDGQREYQYYLAENESPS